MSVIIKFRNGIEWFKANWVYRQIVADVIAQSPDDVELAAIMQQGQSYGMLSLDKLETHVGSKVLGAIKRTAQDTLQGKIPGWKETKPDDVNGQKLYLESVAELLDLIKQDEFRGRASN